MALWAPTDATGGGGRPPFSPYSLLLRHHSASACACAWSGRVLQHGEEGRVEGPRAARVGRPLLPPHQAHARDGRPADGDRDGRRAAGAQGGRAHRPPHDRAHAHAAPHRQRVPPRPRPRDGPRRPAPRHALLRRERAHHDPERLPRVREVGAHRRVRLLDGRGAREARGGGAQVRGRQGPQDHRAQARRVHARQQGQLRDHQPEGHRPHLPRHAR